MLGNLIELLRERGLAPFGWELFDETRGAVLIRRWRLFGPMRYEIWTGWVGWTRTSFRAFLRPLSVGTREALDRTELGSYLFLSTSEEAYALEIFNALANERERHPATFTAHPE